MLESLVRHGLTALVTLHHFTNPRWFAERGGWLAPDAVDRFADYCDVVARELGDLIPYACTINEPQIVALFGHLLGYHPPGLTNDASWRRATTNLLAAHHRAVAALRAGGGSPKAGICLQLPDLQPARADDESCVALCRELRDQMHDVWVQPEAVAGDFVGVQYYTRMRTLMGWEVHPGGLLSALRSASRVGLPLSVTENGVAAADDGQRVDYLDSHLRMILAARAEGLDVRGYVYWSSFDNFEWAEGYAPTFGLVGIDRADGLRRVVRPSAEAFARVARTGRLASLRELGRPV